MKPALKIGFIFTGILIAIRLIIYFTKADLNEKPVMLLSMFLITCSASVALYLAKRSQKQQNTLMDDLKVSMAPSMIFTVLVSAFSFLYYNNIHTDYIGDKLKNEEVRWTNSENIKKLKLNNPIAYDNLSDEEIKSQQMNTAKTLLSPSFNMSISLLLMSVWTIMNGIVLSLIFRGVIFRHHFESVPPKES